LPVGIWPVALAQEGVIQAVSVATAKEDVKELMKSRYSEEINIYVLKIH
jgi:hypothetical protein